MENTIFSDDAKHLDQALGAVRLEELGEYEEIIEP